METNLTYHRRAMSAYVMLALALFVIYIGGCDRRKGTLTDLAEKSTDKTTMPNRSWTEFAQRVKAEDIHISKRPTSTTVWKSGIPTETRCGEILRTANPIDREAYMRRGHVGGHDLTGNWTDPETATTFVWRIQPGGVGTVSLSSGELVYLEWK